MKVALLCTGPSLPQVYCEDFFVDYGSVIALNTAGRRFAHHWLCGSDRHVLEPVLQDRFRRPLVGFITNSAWGREGLKQGFKWRPLALHNVDYVARTLKATADSQNSRTCAYSMPNALHYAYLMAEGDPVHIYGMDMSEEPLDFNGQKGDHSSNRWIQESAWLRAIWRQETVVYGNASPAVLDYLYGRSHTHPFAVEQRRARAG